MDNVVLEHNTKLRTMVKEIIYRSVLDLIKSRDLLKEDTGVITSSLKDIVNLKVDNDITMLVNETMKNENVQGQLTTVLNGVLNGVDIESVTPGVINGNISSVHKDLINVISERLYNELSIYKTIYLPTMRHVSTRAKAMMDNINHIDIDEVFNLEYAEEHYLNNIIIERGYHRNVLEVSNTNNLYTTPLNVSNTVDTLSVIKSTEYADVSVILQELESSGDIDDMITNIDTMLSEANTVMLFIKELYRLDVKDTLFLGLLLMYFKHSIKSKVFDLDVLDINYIINKISNRLITLRSTIKTYIDNDVVLYRVIKDDDNITLCVIRDNFSKLFKANEDINISDIYGCGVILTLEQKESNKLIKVSDIEDNKNEYNRVYNKYIHVLTSKDRLTNISNIKNIYSIVIREVNSNLYQHIDSDGKNDIMNRTLDIVNKLDLNVLLDPLKTVNIIFENISERTNNFALFSKELNNAKKVLGDDTDINTAIVYSAVSLLSKYFVNQLRVV